MLPINCSCLSQNKYKVIDNHSMLSKMAQPNSIGAGGGGGSGPTAGGRRVPLSLSGAGAGSISRLQQAAAGSNGRSNSPQNSNTGKKNETNLANGPFVSIKKSSINQHAPSSGSSSTTSSSSSLSKDDKNQNGSSRSTNGNSKAGQNGSSIPVAKEHQKPKEKHADKKDSTKSESKDELKPLKGEAKSAEPAAVDTKNKNEATVSEIIELDDEPAVVAVSTTPTSERKSSRRIGAASQQKPPNKSSESPIKPQPKESPIKSQPKESPIKPQQSESPAKPQPSESPIESPVQKKQEIPAEAVEDVEMESLTVDASPIRTVASSAQPTATSTPGRNLFGFLSASKQANEVERASQQPITPTVAVARNLSQISGRRSIRAAATYTPGRMGNYRSINTSDLDTSGCTNTSMNATVGSEIPNSSSFSFSFFGRSRKRERTPPPLSGSQSTNDLAQDVQMSPPKRARFDLFSMNLVSPFSILRSRFSKATISSPSSRQRLEQTPPTGDDEEGDGEVQNVSGIIIQEEEEQHINSSSTTEEVTVGKEAGLDTPKKSGTPDETAADVADENKIEDQGEDAVANLPATDVAEGEGPNRSRCAIM